MNKKFFLTIYIILLTVIVVSCNGSSLDTIKAKVKEIISKSYSDYKKDLTSENVIVKKEALEYFCDNPDDSVANDVLKALDDRSTMVKVAAIKAVGSNKIEKAIDKLIALLSDSDSEVVKQSIIALGKIGEKNKSPKAIIPFLNKNEFQYESIWALGNIGDKSAISPLTKLLSSNDKYLVYNATIALKKIR